MYHAGLLSGLIILLVLPNIGNPHDKNGTVSYGRAAGNPPSAMSFHTQFGFWARKQDPSSPRA